VGDSYQLSGVVKDAAGSEVSGAELAWSSSNTSLATITSSGVVSALAKGTVKFTATSGSASDDSQVTVAEESDGGTGGGGGGGGDGTPIFSDDFESGDRTHTENGMKWSGAKGGNGGVSMPGGFGRNESQYSLRFRYGATDSGTDSFAEQSFRGLDTSEMWVEYWLFIPANFKHRHDLPGNNKLMQLNYTGSKSQILTLEYQRQSDTSSSMRRFLSTSKHLDGTKNWPTTDRNTPDFIGPNGHIKPGQWSQIRVHYKASSGADIYDGRAEIFVNGTLVHGLDWAFWDPTYKGQINGGYLMGWANSGFDEQTEFFIDDFKVWTSNPGWK
jgi:hypothetical protein